MVISYHFMRANGNIAAIPALTGEVGRIYEIMLFCSLQFGFNNFFPYAFSAIRADDFPYPVVCEGMGRNARIGIIALVDNFFQSLIGFFVQARGRELITAFGADAVFEGMLCIEIIYTHQASK